MQSLSVTELLLFQWGMNITRYLVLAGGAWLVFWKWLYPIYESRKVYIGYPTRAQLKREILYSFLTMTIFLLPALLVTTTDKFGLSKVYYNFHEQSLGWYLFTYVALFFWHETYFYWAHRLMHLKYLYRPFHHVHHLSKEPTPFTAFSFHPLEAIVESGAIVSLTFLIPVHVSALVLFTLFSLLFNVYGHLGIRLFEHKKGLFRYLNSPEKHALHHSRYRGNYGLYTVLWDRIMGTEIQMNTKKTGAPDPLCSETPSD